MSRALGCTLLLAFSLAALSQEDSYIQISDDPVAGIELQKRAKQAYKNKLNAGDAVIQLFKNAGLPGEAADPATPDIIDVTNAVVDAWPACEDTFDAIKAAVMTQPERATEIVATMTLKRNCNCTNGGLWLDQDLEERTRVSMRREALDVPVQCSCSQIAIYAGCAGLPENREYRADLDAAEKAGLVAQMARQVDDIMEHASTLQNRNDWECGCVDINLVACMQGISDEELRLSTYEELSRIYEEELANANAGESSLSCRVENYSHVMGYPEVPVPLVRLPAIAPKVKVAPTSIESASSN